MARLLVLIDNVVGTLGTPALCAALTQTIWKDRILGESKMTPEIPLMAQWVATGNNVALGQDMARRTLEIRLEAACERPEERTGFRHPHIKSWCRENRRRLLCSALTVLRAYFDAGCPDLRLKPWGSYEDWSRVVRGAVVFAGFGDPGDARATTEEASTAERSAVPEFLDAWEKAFPDGRTRPAREVISFLLGGGSPELSGVIAQMCQIPSQQFPTPKALGEALARVRGVVVRGRCLEGVRDADGVTFWRLRPPGSCSP